MPFNRFRASLADGDPLANIRHGLIGEGLRFETPFGTRTLVYADYTASGRALRQVETFIAEEVLPSYANSHTEASYCGARTTQLRNAARAFIARELNAGPDCSVIFSGSGATSAINRLVALTGIAELARVATSTSERPVVFHGPYEHHSNILPWRESGAEVIEIDEAASGGPDLDGLRKRLEAMTDRPLVIGVFSAASNVTGIIADIDRVTALLKQFGALAFWDFAGGGPYLPVDMNPKAGPAKDAVILSPHKFLGGPGASGLLVVRHSAVRSQKPTWPGGGSVAYVSPWAHDYLDSLIEREEAGTPNVIGDIRAALALAVKAAVGLERIAARDHELCIRALEAWSADPRIFVLGNMKAERLPIFSFCIRDGAGGFIHHQLVTRMLSDHYGIQARGGCVCAGPYGHRLLGVDRSHSERIRGAIIEGREIEKPGWVRLNLSYVMDDATVGRIIEAVDLLAKKAESLATHYVGDSATAQFVAIA